MKTKVKICGIRHIESAVTAVAYGADFLGFNFVLSSHRFINPIRARPIIDAVRKKTKIVGVFQRATIDEINEHVKYLKLDYVQLYGNEDEHLIKKIKSQVIKTFSLAYDFDPASVLKQMKQYSVRYFLLDRLVQGQGEPLDAQKAKIICQEAPIFLAGGLNTENIAEVISQIRPFAVDVAGGIETGNIEDLHKIESFLSLAKKNYDG